MELTNKHHSFSIKITAFNQLGKEEETIKEITIDETSINTINTKDIFDELEECIDEAMDHIIDRMEDE